ncbi:MAG TPA: hypothetical protein PKW61_00010 [Tenuifilaceae bacterium]|jgi:hypothetical protein|nr:hypothetical protein [Tenuifilaceae bacterium]
MKELVTNLDNLSIEVTSFVLDALRKGNYENVSYNSEGISSLNIVGFRKKDLLRLIFKTNPELFEIQFISVNGHKNTVILNLVLRNAHLLPDNVFFLLKHLAYKGKSDKLNKNT